MKLFSQKMGDMNVKSIFFIITYASLSILGIVYFKNILKIVGHFFQIISPFIYGGIIAFIFQIPEPFIESHLKIGNQKKKRLIATLLSIVFVFLVLCIIMVIILPQVVDNITALINNLPGMFKQSESYLQILLEQLKLNEDIAKEITVIQNDLGSAIISFISALVPSFVDGITSITSRLTNVFMGVIIAVYMSLDKDKLSRQFDKTIYALFNKKQYLFIKDTTELILKTFRQFFTGQITESFIIGILCYIGCKLLGIPYASIAAIIIGITNIIPYFGPFIGSGISALLILLVSPVKAIIFIIFGSLLQQFESNIIYPHVVGNSVGLSALWVLFAITLGGGLFGITGMVFGLPIFSVIYELSKRFINLRLENKKSME